MVGISDPVRHPLPLGGVESRRQEVARCRADLAESVGQLAPALAPPVAARRLGTIVAPYLGIGLGVGLGVVALALAGRRSRWLAAGAVGVAGVASGLWRLARSAPPPANAVVAADRPADALGQVGAAAGADDVVDVLTAAHRRIEAMFEAVLATDDPGHRRERLALLVEFLARHEHAEQQVVRPVLRSLSPESEPVIDDRLAEERAADRAVAALVSRNVDDAGFVRRLTDLRDMVVAHAKREEEREFPLIRARLPRARRQALAAQVRKGHAEA